MHAGDGFVLFLLAIVLGGWAFYLFRRWWLRPVREEEWTVDADDEIIVTEAVELLEQAGYEVLTNKRKIPVSIKIDDSIKLDTRLFIDHFAEEGESIYIVKIARDSHPVEMNEKGIRDELLLYQLLYPDAAGVLYVDTAAETVHKIEFVIDA